MRVILTQNEFNSIDEKTLEAIGDSVLSSMEKTPSHAVVGVFYVSADEIHKINKEYRGKDKPTDVITFRLLDNPQNVDFTKENFPYDFDEALEGIYLGEIFICIDVAATQASEYNHSTTREVAELFVHGMLHILGHDHENEEERNKMKSYELMQMPLLDKLIK